MAAPSTAVLDNFNRANGSIATGESRWTTPGLYQGSVAVLITGSQAYGSSSFAEAYWNAATYTDCEIGYTIATPHGTGQYAYVWARGQNPNTSTASGYELIIERSSGTDVWYLNRVISQSPTQLATRSQEISAGDAFALVVLGTGATVTLQIWYRPSGGSWTQLGADVSDTSGSRITAAGRIGFGSNSTTVRMDDVFGGAQSAGTGPVTVEPGPASVASSVVGPTVVRGALSLAPAPAAAAGGVAGPDVAALVVSPAPAAAAGSVVDPAVATGGVSVGPSPAAAATSTTLTPFAYGQAALRLFGTATGGIDRALFPLTTSGGAVSTPLNVGAGSFTYDVRLRCLYADNASEATDARYGNVVLDRDVWDHPRGHCPLVLTRRDGALVVMFGANNGSGAWPAIRGTTNVGDGQYHHVAVERDGDTVRLYVDGQVDASGTFSTADWSYPLSYTPTGGSDNPYLVLGAEKHDYIPGAGGFAGLVDELRVSSVARYGGSAFTPPDAPYTPDASTVGLFHLDHASGTTVADSATVSGAPTSGELRVGGASSGPQWDGRVAFPWGVVAAPAAAQALAGAAAPTVVRGALILAPAPAAAAGGAVAPAVVRGALSLTPAPASAAGSAAAPGVVAGAVSIAPAAAQSLATAPGPVVVRGALALSPAPAQAAGTAEGPAVVAGALVLAPAAAQALAGAAAPLTIAGPILLAAAAAVVAGETADPQIAGGGINVAPGPALAAAAALAPGVVLGALSLAPGAAQAAGTAEGPVTVLGPASVAPAAALALAAAPAPVVVRGALSLAPAPAQATAAAAGSGVAGGGVLVEPDGAEVAGSVVAPTVVRGAVLLEPAPAGALGAASPPVALQGALSLSPAPATVLALVGAPTVQSGAPELPAAPLARSWRILPEDRVWRILPEDRTWRL